MTNRHRALSSADEPCRESQKAGSSRRVRKELDGRRFGQGATAITEDIYQIAELMALGYEAYHVERDGASWLFHGCWALRRDAVHGTRTLVTDVDLMPVGPWRLTSWGAQERARNAASDDWPGCLA
jgi:hypothetical protein